jgi:adenine-specific DNA-methyltransferase
MDKPKFETLNYIAENRKKLAELFPGVVTDGKINVDLLCTYIGEELFKDEAYEFTWVGKRTAITEAAKPIRKTLRPVMEDETTPTGEDSTGNPYCSSGSKNWETTENLYIEGDNVDVLKLLQESYLGKVKMIYIDPPYNTGNDFIYRDIFTRKKDEYDEEAGVYDDDGNRLFKNTESNGRFHSDWCSMILPRLILGRNLLRDDGLIFISIDDSEVAQLRKICDEVFGESNFLACIVWQKKTSPDARMDISSAHDYIIVYAKNSVQENYLFNSLPYDEERLANYKNPDNDPRGPWASVDMTGQTGRAPKSQFYEIVTPSGKKYFPPDGRCWAMAESTFKELRADNRIWFGEKGDNRPRIKKFLSESEGMRPWTWWTNKFASHNQEGNQELMKLFDGKLVFDNPKPTKLLKQIISLATKKDGGHICLDFFSGSATLAQAVMEKNAEDNGNRRFICVQVPQSITNTGNEFKANNVAVSLGYKNICEIGKERIRRAGEKIKEEYKDKPGIENLDIGFRVLKLDSTNMKDVYYAPEDYSQDSLFMMEDNIKEDRTDMDLLYACLLDWGLPLSMPHKQEKIGGFTVHTYNDGDLIACFDKHISEEVVKEIARRQPLRAVFRDSSFASSPEKINVEEIFKLFAPNTSVKVI